MFLAVVNSQCGGFLEQKAWLRPVEALNVSLRVEEEAGMVELAVSSLGSVEEDDGSIVSSKADAP